MLLLVYHRLFIVILTSPMTVKTEYSSTQLKDRKQFKRWLFKKEKSCTWPVLCLGSLQLSCSSFKGWQMHYEWVSRDKATQTSPFPWNFRQCQYPEWKEKTCDLSFQCTACSLVGKSLGFHSSNGVLLISSGRLRNSSFSARTLEPTGW